MNREWSCTRKHRYKTKSKALHVLESHLKQFPDHESQGYGVYHCAFCHGYHIGRNRGIRKYNQRTKG